MHVSCQESVLTLFMALLIYFDEFSKQPQADQGLPTGFYWL